MAISKKGRRKIIYKGRKFYWKVLPEFSYNSDMLSVSIVSENKKFIVKYFVFQYRNDGKHQIKIIGEEFPRKDKTARLKGEIICPQFIKINDKKNFVSPSDIELILDWCYDNSECTN